MPFQQRTEKELHEFLYRIRHQQRLPKDVASDPDMPSYETVMRQTRRDSAYKKKYYEAIWSLPIKMQASIQLLSPEFKDTCRKLVAAGVTKYKIAKMFDVSQVTVNNMVKESKNGNKAA